MYQIVLFALLIFSTTTHSFEPIPPVEPSFEQYYSFTLRISPSYAKVWIIKPEKMLYTDTMLLKKQDYTIQVTADGYEDKIIDIKVDSQHLYPIILEKIEAMSPNTKVVTIENMMYENQLIRTKYTWTEAEKYCQNLSLNGYKDWRLPTLNDLHAISNIPLYGLYNDEETGKWFTENHPNKLRSSRGDSHFIRKEFIENMPPFSPWFWTSEHKDVSDNFFKSTSDNFFWIVTFDFGYDAWIDSSAYVRCVRDLM